MRRTVVGGDVADDAMIIRDSDNIHIAKMQRHRETNSETKIKEASESKYK